jgi:hypothetical protein
MVVVLIFLAALVIAYPFIQEWRSRQRESVDAI